MISNKAGHQRTLLADGGISYRASGMTVRMKYRFLDDGTIEYTDPSMPNWSLVQKRQ